MKPLVLVVLLLTSIKGIAEEKWVSSNPTGTLNNKCNVKYKIPTGFSENEELKRRSNAITILIPKNTSRTQSIAIDFAPMEDSIDSFEKYRNGQIEFLKKYKVSVDVEVLNNPISSKNEESIFEEWKTLPDSKNKVFKRVYRIKKQDGYYSISFNADSEKLLREYPFEEFLNTVSMDCQ